MNAGGWIFLVVSLSFVWGLVIWCYSRILSVSEPPPEPVQDFRSA